MQNNRATSTPMDGARGRGRLIACTALAMAAHAPLVSIHLMHLWNRPHYRFVFPLIALAGWLIWRRWPQDIHYVPARFLERLLLVASCGILSTAVWMNSPFLAAVSATFSAGFLILHSAGIRAIPYLTGPWCLLWLAVPPPLGYDMIIISRMQALTSQMASLLLDLAGINHLMSGNVLTLAGQTFFVDEACSGVHSLFALFGYTALYVTITSRGFRRSLLLLLSSFGWAIVLNLVRVTTIAFAHVRWQVDLSQGWPHEALGLTTFLLALALTLSTDQWLHFLSHSLAYSRHSLKRHFQLNPTKYQPSITVAERHLNQQLRLQESMRTLLRPSPLVSLIAIGLYGLLLTANVSAFTTRPPHMWSQQPLAPINENLLPQTIAGRTRTSFQKVERDISSDLGATSCVWEYAGQPTVIVSLDASFPGWHELSRCYEGQGWRVDNRTVRRQGGLSWVESQLSKSTGERGLLVFSLMTADGKPITPPVEAGASRLIDRLKDEQSLQIQVFAEASGAADEHLQQDLRRVFLAAFDQCQMSRLSLPVSTNSQGGHDG